LVRMSTNAGRSRSCPVRDRDVPTTGLTSME
jgi:hypothetical protein